MHYCLCCLGWPGSVFVSFLFYVLPEATSCFQRPLPVSPGTVEESCSTKSYFLACLRLALNSERCTELTKSSNLNCRFVFFFVYWLKSLVSTLTSALLTYTHFSAFFFFFLFCWFTPLPPWSSHQPERSSFCHVRQRGEAWWFSFLFKKKKKCVALTIWAGLQFVLLCFFFLSSNNFCKTFFFLTFTETMIHNFITSLVKGDLWSKKCYMPFQWGKRKNKTLHLIIATLFRDISSISLSLSHSLSAPTCSFFFLLWLFQKQLFSSSLFLNNELWTTYVSSNNAKCLFYIM